MKGKLVLKHPEKRGFLAKYALGSRVLKAAEKIRGVPALRSGTDVDGESVLIKTWPRDLRIDDTDLREIWRNETRQLYRLGGLRGADDLIAQLRTSTVDDTGFHLVLSIGQRLPLAFHLSTNDELPYSNRRTVRGRHLIWSNLLRIAKGLDILHLQGMLHRNLTAWSVLTDNGPQADFQLTGFEWSMRIVGLDDHPHQHRGRASALGGNHSFARDWQQFGTLATQLFGIAESRIANRSIASHDVAETMTAAEVRLIREVSQILPADRLDGQAVISQIEKLLLALNASIQNEDFVFQILLPLGPQGRIASVIRRASDNQLEVDDEDAQLTFIENDLSDASVIALRGSNPGEAYQLAVRGGRLTYYLSDYRKTKDRISSNWEIAFCSGAGISNESSGNPIASIPLARSALSLVTLSEHSRSRVRMKTTSWQLLRQQLMPGTKVNSADKLLLKSLVLIQALDYVFAASDVFPVVVAVPGRELDSNGDGKIEIEVRPRRDDGRDRLSSVLELKDPPAKRLANALLGDQVKDDRKVSWVLTDQPALGERSDSTTEWQFQSEKRMTTGESVYVFVGEKYPTTFDELYLVPSDSAGRDSQLVRRLRSLAALSEHRELSGMLCDPRARILSSHDAVTEDDGFKSLDHSKQAVFRKVVETLPLFLVQGPPGVGKTRLVRELVRQTLSTDSSTRLLLSAQSNYAVDHLMQEIENILKEDNESEAVVIRCAPPDRKDADTRFDLGRQTKKVLSALIQSPLLSEASAALKDRVSGLASVYGIAGAVGDKSGTAAAASVARKALEGLILRSANLVFATTNSGDLETLIEEKSQFDWTLIEEAAKATGPELITPLLLSPRRLMIGDHLQLPPFGEERILSLLNHPVGVKRALEMANQMVGRSFRDSAVDELFGEMGNGAQEMQAEDLAKLCDEAVRNFSLFQTLIETEYSRQKRIDGGIPIAVPLTQQHRMHPAISKIVSDGFYKGKLSTEPTAAARFRQETSPIGSIDSKKLPDSPVVWVDMPWIQDTLGMKVGEEFPRFINREEVDAVFAVLKSLAQSSPQSAPSLAILSPYSRQVRALSQMVSERRERHLPNLAGFRAASRDNSFCTTVDSFQGSEADCVVVSLVRNNGYGGVRSALGFLADSRRMNVLLSRAKWRLVIVGSLAFLRSVCENSKSSEDQRTLDFLGRILTFFDPGTHSDGVSVVSYKVLRGEDK